MNPYIPANDKQRKSMPFFRFITGYFPRTIREMMKVSVVNNVRYNPDRDPADINWNRAKSADQLGSGVRHLLEREVDGKIFEEVAKEVAEKTGIERVYVLAEAAWRICAACEQEIERVETTEAKAEAKVERSEAELDRLYVGDHVSEETRHLVRGCGSGYPCCAFSESYDSPYCCQQVCSGRGHPCLDPAVFAERKRRSDAGLPGRVCS